MDTESLEPAWKTIPPVLVTTLLFEEVPSISRVSDTSFHHFSYSQNYITKITAVILILLSVLILMKKGLFD